jgi:hypothetical protein
MSAPARRVVLILLGSLLLLGQGSVALAASPGPDATPPAGTTLTAEPSIITAVIQPGGQSISTLTLHAGRALDITIEPEGLGQTPEDGSFGFLTADEDLSEYTARPFITVEPATFRLEAGETKQIEITITIPVGAGDGERYALLKVAGQPVPGTGNVGIGVALGVSTLVTLQDTAQQLTGTLTGLAVGGYTPDQPVNVTGIIENSGNTHYGAAPSTVYQLAVLRDGDGREVTTARGTLTGNSIIPTFGRQFMLSLVDAGPLDPGSYSVDVEVGLDGGAVLDRGTVSLVVPGGAVLPATGRPAESEPPIATILLAIAVGVLLTLVLLGGRTRRRPATSQ